MQDFDAVASLDGFPLQDEVGSAFHTAHFQTLHGHLLRIGWSHRDFRSVSIDEDGNFLFSVRDGGVIAEETDIQVVGVAVSRVDDELQVGNGVESESLNSLGTQEFIVAVGVQVLAGDAVVFVVIVPAVGSYVIHPGLVFREGAVADFLLMHSFHNKVAHGDAIATVASRHRVRENVDARILHIERLVSEIECVLAYMEPDVASRLPQCSTFGSVPIVTSITLPCNAFVSSRIRIIKFVCIIIAVGTVKYHHNQIVSAVVVKRGGKIEVVPSLGTVQIPRIHQCHIGGRNPIVATGERSLIGMGQINLHIIFSRHRPRIGVIERYSVNCSSRPYFRSGENLLGA